MRNVEAAPGPGPTKYGAFDSTSGFIVLLIRAATQLSAISAPPMTVVAAHTPSGPE